MIRHIDNQRVQDKIVLARELRQAADDITEGQFDLVKSRALGANHAKLVKSVQRRDARITQLIDEWFERIEKRLKVSPDMLDQANVLRKVAHSLECNKIDFDEVGSVIAALAYAYGFDYGYRRFLKERKELLPERSRARIGLSRTGTIFKKLGSGMRE